MSQTSTFQSLVGFFGNQIKTAELLKVDQATVSGWVRGKHGMSPAVALRAEKLTEGEGAPPPCGDGGGGVEGLVVNWCSLYPLCCGGVGSQVVLPLPSVLWRA